MMSLQYTCQQLLSPTNHFSLLWIRLLFTQQSFTTKQPSYRVNSEAWNQSFKINLKAEMSHHHESMAFPQPAVDHMKHVFMFLKDVSSLQEPNKQILLGKC